jgi:hypothetical protein
MTSMSLIGGKLAVLALLLMPLVQGATAPGPELATQAAMLIGLTGSAFRFGRWRERMYNTEHNVVAEIGRHRAELSDSVARLEGRLSAIDAHMATAVEQRVISERWQSRVDVVLEGVDSRLSRIERQLELRGEGRLEGVDVREAA